MEADDDMLVVIVGDGEDDANTEFPAPIEENEDVLGDDEIEKLIETAEMHGEFVKVNVNEECEDWDSDDDDEYVPDDDIEEDEDGDDDDDDGSGNEFQNRQRHTLLKPSQRKSFVNELRDQYPELEDDNKALVTTLSEIMRNIKPPPPPQDYFIMNGIMFECVTCGFLADTQGAASRHFQDKHGERYLICFACGVDFRSTTNLYKHEKRCTAPDAVVVLKARAVMLGRRGRSRPYGNKNLPPANIRKGVNRRYSCSQCPASFVSKTYLRSHEMLHRGERPYTCNQCPRAYTSLAALSRHRKKHSDEQYICDHCGRPFKVKATLVTHMDTHLPVKPYGCAKCERRYATKAAMVRHERRVHLGLPPRCVCKICHKRYPLMSVLKEHTKRAHGLLLMTRRMFFQTLPTLTETQINQAKVVLKSEMEPDSYSLEPLPETTLGPVARSVELPNNQDYMSDHTIYETPECQFETVIKSEDVGEDDDDDDDNDDDDDVDDDESSNQQITLSEEVLQYLQAIQGEFVEGTSYNIILTE